MRILILTQWFQPEPHFKGLPLAVALRDRGHEVEVLTGFPNYPGGRVYDGYRIRVVQREWMDGIRVTRGALYPSHDRSALRRILNYASFAVSSTLLALTLRRPDVVYVYTPPMTAAAAAVLLRLVRRVPFVVDVQDLWPETLAATGMVNNGRLLRLVGGWTDFVFRRAARIVVLSPGFAARIRSRIPRAQVTVVPNWAPDDIATLSLPAPAGGGRFEILFAGNMGKAQALDTVIRAARRLQDEGIAARFTLIGGGVDADALRAEAEAEGLDTIRFLPPRHPRDMGAVFAEADALLVHLRDDPLFAITIPSKTQAYLAVGRPILMGVRGDAAAMVAAAGAGIAFEPESPDALVAAVRSLMAMPPAARAAMGEAGRRYYGEHLSFDHGVNALTALLSDAAQLYCR